jgi:S1-C subfamily serine protease
MSETAESVCGGTVVQVVLRWGDTMRNGLFWSIGLIVVVCLSQQVQADDAATIIKRAKASTSFVVLPNERGSATTFCVDSSGYFLTNAHVVESLQPGEKLSIVIDPGEDDEKIVQAAPVRVDKTDDLALLKTNVSVELTPLHLGDSGGLYETQQVTIFGYPFGKMLSLNKGDSPSISVNVARISSMRKLKDKLELIQLDSQLNPGNSGGPVVDEHGDVIGIVSSGVLAAGINFAVPVNKMVDFLGKPIITCDASNIDIAKANGAFDLPIQVAAVGTANHDLHVEVAISTAGGVERIFAADPVGAKQPGQYVAHVVPGTSSAVHDRYPAIITFSNGSMKCSIREQAFTLDGKHFNLSGTSTLEIGPEKKTVTARDGTQTTGNVLAIAPLDADFGAVSMKVDVSKALRVAINPPEQNPTINYRITARNHGAVVGELAGTLGDQSPSTIADADPPGDSPVAAAPGAPGLPGPWMDLVRRINLEEDTDAGTWARSGDSIINVHPNNKEETCRLTIPVMPTGDYEMDFTFIRHGQATQDLCVLFPAGGHGAEIMLGGFTGQLDELIGTGVKGRNDIVRIMNERPEHVNLVVHGTEGQADITMKINGVELLTWNGDVSRLQVGGDRATRDGRTLGLAVYASTIVEFKNIRARALTGQLQKYVTDAASSSSFPPPADPNPIPNPAAAPQADNDIPRQGDPYTSFEQMFATLPPELQPRGHTWYVTHRTNPELTHRLSGQAAVMSAGFASVAPDDTGVEVTLDTGIIDYRGFQFGGQIKAHFPADQAAQFKDMRIHDPVTISGTIKQVVLRGGNLTQAFLWLEDCKVKQ